MELKIYHQRDTADGLELVCLLKPDSVSAGFNEDATYLIPIPQHDAILQIDDAPLTKTVDGQYWVWKPEFYAGQVVASLTLPTHFQSLQYYLDVSPNPEKLGSEQLLHYIADIVDFAPELLFGTEPARHQLGGAGSFHSCWISYIRLKTYGDQLLHSLGAIRERPLQKVKHQRHHLPINQVKRVDITTLFSLAQSPTLAYITNPSITANESVHTSMDFLNVPYYEQTYNHPANEVMLDQLLRVLRLVKQLQVQLSMLADYADGARTKLAPRLPERLKFLRFIEKKLQSVLNNKPFANITHPRTTAAGLNAISADPRYAYSYGLISKILRRGISSLEEDEWHYLSPTWQIYETWTFCVLAKALRGRFSDTGWALKRSSDTYYRFVGKLANQAQITLHFQPTCPSMRRGAHGYSSISKTRIPDLIFEYTHEQLRYICLDAKYRTRRNYLLDAMSSAHIYHDAIRHGDIRPASAILLSPTAQEVEALTHTDYIADNQVGCLSLLHDHNAETVTDFLLNAVMDMQK